MIKRILVIGGTGMLGQPVARRLQADGYQVRVLSRSAERARQTLGPGFEIAEGDVEDPAALANALDGCQGVHISLYGGFDADLERRGAECVARLAQAAGIEQITYLSGGSVAEENCWFAGTRARYQAEQALLKSGIPYTIFRANFFMEALYKFVRGKFGLVIGRHRQPYYWLAAEDFAVMVSRAFARPEAKNKTLYAWGPEPYSMRQAVEMYCRIVHPQNRVIFMPIWAAWMFANLGKRQELQANLPFFRYCETVEIKGKPDECWALLGKPVMTLERWSRAERGEWSVETGEWRGEWGGKRSEGRRAN